MPSFVGIRGAKVMTMPSELGDSGRIVIEEPYENLQFGQRSCCSALSIVWLLQSAWLGWKHGCKFELK